MLLAVRSGFSQDRQPVSVTQQVRWKLTTKPAELFLVNFPLTVERVFGNSTLGLTLAYRPALQDGGTINGFGSGLSGAYKNQYVFNFVAQGLYIGLNSKQYLFRGRGRDVYFDIDVYYRSWWYRNKQAEYDKHVGYKFNALRNEQVNVRGFKVLIGRSWVFQRGKRMKWVVDLYAGPGARYKHWEYESFNGSVNRESIVYEKERDGEWELSAHGGVQFGFGFK
jgi:hypothetical protein